MVEFEAAGDVGRLWRGYQLAANIRDWHLIRSRDTIGPGATVVKARIWSADAFWSTQRPLRLELWLGQSWWVWETEIDPAVVIESDKWMELVAMGIPTTHT